MANGFIVKVHVGQRGKQAVDQQPGNFLRAGSLLPCGLCQSDQPANQFVLQVGCLRLFSADAGLDAALVARSLLALKAKHI